MEAENGHAWDCFVCSDHEFMLIKLSSVSHNRISVLFFQDDVCSHNHTLFFHVSQEKRLFFVITCSLIEYFDKLRLVFSS